MKIVACVCQVMRLALCSAEHNCWTQPLSMISKCCMSMCVVWRRRSWGDSDVKDWCDDWSKISGYRFLLCWMQYPWDMKVFLYLSGTVKVFPHTWLSITSCAEQMQLLLLSSGCQTSKYQWEGKKKKKSRALNRVFMRVPPTFPLLYLFTIILAVFSLKNVVSDYVKYHFSWLFTAV